MLEKYHHAESQFDYLQIVADFSEEALNKMILLNQNKIQLIARNHIYFNLLFIF